ncbi:NAD(P)-dependent alcohol dehydrogenase [uncultured Proteiniphilum sp.]|uniref:NAD(P)-dependent alcohol dehydrogenase n=1 Tax=uncultured Proteiniphilum sp. TaxID=497637 RepID=UPI00261BE0CD|nr:NAD(P)-dependent alcohol dehydrogenase [uncultured Proteiniphilum sp.]
MKAAVYTRYGSPEVVKITEVDKPELKDNEVLIKVVASTVNRTDSGFRSAQYFVSRFWSGLFRPKIRVLGCEFTGVVEETGKSVTRFRKGDKIFGFDDNHFGGHAEYLAIGEDSAITIMPSNATFYDAAPVTEGAHYALGNIRAAKVEKGNDVMVYGATGAIGSAAVQLLKHFGANVTAVCNTKNVELIRSLGADRVIDYQTGDFTKTGTKFSFIFDAVGKSSFGRCKPLLSKNGIYISTELGKNGENIFLALSTVFRNGKKVLFPIPAITQADVIFLRNLFEAGTFKPVIDRYYKLDEIVDAYRYVETGQKTGNVVLKIAE